MYTNRPTDLYTNLPVYKFLPSPKTMGATPQLRRACSISPGDKTFAELILGVLVFKPKPSKFFQTFRRSSVILTF